MLFRSERLNLRIIPISSLWVLLVLVNLSTEQWTNSTVTAAIKDNGDAHSGVARTEYSLDGGSWTLSLIHIFGRYLYAIGNNRESTRLSGIKGEKWELLAYIVAGSMAAVAGILMTSRMNTAYPSIGSGDEMNAVAACVIGGASLAGGKGTICLLYTSRCV